MRDMTQSVAVASTSSRTLTPNSSSSGTFINPDDDYAHHLDHDDLIPDYDHDLDRDDDPRDLDFSEGSRLVNDSVAFSEDDVPMLEALAATSASASPSPVRRKAKSHPKSRFKEQAVDTARVQGSPENLDAPTPAFEDSVEPEVVLSSSKALAPTRVTVAHDDVDHAWPLAERSNRWRFVKNIGWFFRGLWSRIFSRRKTNGTSTAWDSSVQQASTTDLGAPLNVQADEPEADWTKDRRLIAVLVLSSLLIVAAFAWKNFQNNSSNNNQAQGPANNNNPDNAASSPKAPPIASLPSPGAQTSTGQDNSTPPAADPIVSQEPIVPQPAPSLPIDKSDVANSDNPNPLLLVKNDEGGIARLPIPNHDSKNSKKTEPVPTPVAVDPPKEPAPSTTNSGLPDPKPPIPDAKADAPSDPPAPIPTPNKPSDESKAASLIGVDAPKPLDTPASTPVPTLEPAPTSSTTPKPETKTKPETVEKPIVNEPSLSAPAPMPVPAAPASPAASNDGPPLSLSPTNSVPVPAPDPKPAEDPKKAEALPKPIEPPSKPATPEPMQPVTPNPMVDVPLTKASEPEPAKKEDPPIPAPPAPAIKPDDPKDKPAPIPDPPINKLDEPKAKVNPEPMPPAPASVPAPIKEDSNKEKPKETAIAANGSSDNDNEDLVPIKNEPLNPAQNSFAQQSEPRSDRVSQPEAITPKTTPAPTKPASSTGSGALASSRTPGATTKPALTVDGDWDKIPNIENIPDTSSNAYSTPDSRLASENGAGLLTRASANNSLDTLSPIDYEVREGDTLWKISRLHYGDSRYHRALWAANANVVGENGELQVGTIVKIPAVESIDRSLVDVPKSPGTSLASSSARWLSSKASNSRSSTPISKTSSGNAGPEIRAQDSAIDDQLEASDDANTRPAPKEKEPLKTYTVQKNNTLRSIARDFLGSSDRASEILKLNQSVIPDPLVLTPGTKLTLPSDARIPRRVLIRQ